MQHNFICVLCGKDTPHKEKIHFAGQEYHAYNGHNPAPLSTTGRCCNDCNFNKVVPARIKQIEDKINYLKNLN